MPVHIGASTLACSLRELRDTEDGPKAWPYFAWAIGLSVPFWVAGFVVEADLAEGVPISGLMVVCPALAASIVSYRFAGTAGVSRLWRRALDGRRVSNKLWFVPAALSIPAAVGATYAITRFAGTAPTFEPVPLSSLLSMSVVFFVAAVTEELGWTGYVTDVLQRHRSALSTGLVIGAVWAVWHWIPLLSAGRSAWWIAWWSVFTVASRVLIVWLYNRSGRSVSVAVVFHAMSNVATVTFADLFDPFITGAIVAAVAVGATAARHLQLRTTAPAGRNSSAGSSTRAKRNSKRSFT